MGAAILKTPELALEESEAKRLAEAINRVNELYDIPVLSEKTMAWVNLAMAGGAIYGPRFVAMNVNKKKKESKVIVMEKPEQYVSTDQPSGVQ